MLGRSNAGDMVVCSGASPAVTAVEEKASRSAMAAPTVLNARSVSRISCWMLSDKISASSPSLLDSRPCISTAGFDEPRGEVSRSSVRELTPASVMMAAGFSVAVFAIAGVDVCFTGGLARCLRSERRLGVAGLVRTTSTLPRGRQRLASRLLFGEHLSGGDSSSDKECKEDCAERAERGGSGWVGL